MATRNGYFFVLDRLTGENLVTSTFGPVNWAKGLDNKGQPIPAELIYPFPAPETIGLTLADDQPSRVAAVSAGSIAAKATAEKFI